MEFSVLALFATTLFAAAGSPGPSIAALVARVISQGLHSVLPFLAAMWVGEAMWLVAAALGLAELVVAAMLVLITVDLVWAFVAGWARRWLKSPRAVRIANRASATAMGGAAVVPATRS